MVKKLHSYRVLDNWIETTVWFFAIIEASNCSMAIFWATLSTEIEKILRLYSNLCCNFLSNNKHRNLRLYSNLCCDCSLLKFYHFYKCSQISETNSIACRSNPFFYLERELDNQKRAPSFTDSRKSCENRIALIW